MKTLILMIALVAACGPSPRHGDDTTGDGGTHDVGGGCAKACSADLHAVVDCNGIVQQQCMGGDACDASTFTCVDACTAAESNHRSVGCDYYATDMDSFMTNYCFAAFVANTWTSAAHINVEYAGATVQVANIARLPVGSGPTLTYGAYDPVAGLPPGQVAVLFLGGGNGAAPLCPVVTAAPNANLSGTGISNSFHIKTDVPVVAYQINPYGGGSAAVTAASLLLPTSAWDAPEQYLMQYIFFADPTYPETNLVVVREHGGDGFFHDVNLDCLGQLTGWQAIGTDYEFTRVNLMTGNFMNVGNCSTGRHEMDSTAPFGLWVWGWGTPLTSTFTANVSYGYPGGMNVTPINTVVIL